MIESITGIFKTKSIWPRGPSRNIDQVEYVTLEWVNWNNNKRLLGPISDIPPVDFEAAYHAQRNGQAMVA